MIRSTPLVVGLLFMAAACPARGEPQTAVGLRVVTPAPDEPAIGRVDVVVAVKAQPETRIETVELEVDGRPVHRWEQPPYELTYDFGVSGRSHRISVRALGSRGLLAATSFETAELRIDESVNLELQQLYITVTDRKGSRQTHLNRDSFTIEDGDVEQEIVTFGVGEIPFTAMVLIDSSLSMKGRRLQAAQVAAQRFVEGMRPLDQAQVLSFSDRLLRTTPVAHKSVLAEALRRPLEALGGTAMRDHLYLATRLLEHRQGRRAIVLLTDGWDQVSVLTMGQLRSAVERSQSVLYWVRLAGDEPTSFHMRSLDLTVVRDFSAIRYQPAPSSWIDETRARQSYRQLEDLVATTGGRVAVAETVGGIEEAVVDVLDELHEQYAIGYYPRPGTGSGTWRPVSVRLSRRGFKVRTREGYVDR